MGPPNMPEKEIEFWGDDIGQNGKTEEWKQTLQKYMWEDFYMNSSETSKFLDEENEKYRELMEIN